MSLKKVFAGVAAAALAVSTLAVSSFAAEAKVEPITLDASDEAAKMVQWDITNFGTEAIQTMEITGKIGGTFGDTGLYQGGWGFGMNAGEAGDWFQPSDPQIAVDIDNNVLDQSVHFEHPRQKYTIDAEVDDEGNLSIKYDFTPMGADAPVPSAEGIAQFGWWWGSDGTADGSTGTFTLTDVIVNNVSLVNGGAAGSETEAPATEAPTVGGSSGGVDNNPPTGVAVAVVPAVIAAGALAAAAVIRKRK